MEELFLIFMKDILRHLHLDKDDFVKFLGLFSRFEFALKASGFYVKGQKDAKPDWDTFANEIDQSFTEKIWKDKNLYNAAIFLTENNTRPKKQIINSAGELIFVNTNIDKNQTNTQQLLLMVRRVRNNLFHGGKFYEKEIIKERDAELVSSSIKVLEESLELNETVKQRFYM